MNMRWFRTRQRIARRIHVRELLPLLAALLALLLVNAHLAQNLHFALISHQICSEHGDLVHASEQGPHAQQPSRLVTAELRARGAHPEHDHCLFLANAPDKIAICPASALEIASASPDSGSIREGGVSHEPWGADILLVAPKQSPPCVCVRSAV
jgi:hypothetical protein